MKGDMTEQDWELARDLARGLAGVDPNAAAKVQSHLRTRRDSESSKTLLQALAVNADKFITMSESQRAQRGVSFIRGEEMGREYKKLAATLNQLFDIGVDAETQARILGWAVRLMRYQGVVGEKAQERTRLLTQERNRESGRQQEMMSSSTQPPARPAMPKAKPQPPRVEKKREAVTLVGAVQGGKARVRTAQNEEVICTGLPSYRPAQAGEVCRAEVAREGGRAVKAFFKGWA